MTVTRHVDHFVKLVGRGWALGPVLLLSALFPAMAAAQGGDTVDWRGRLSCPAEHQVYDGILYCTGQDGNGQTVHVIVVDLTTPGVRFEYVLPKGTSGECDARADPVECRDPNRPQWGGPAGGCCVPGNPELYPRVALLEAVERAREVRGTPTLIGVIDADYGAPNANHGPEGLVVVRGERLDGVAHCDDDYNAALRPWLGLGKEPDAQLGRLRATIDILSRDSAPVPSWIYTGIGGGPWLIREGDVMNSAETCAGERTLAEIDPVVGCTGTPKATPTLPIGEEYSVGSCRLAPHTAAGLSRDGRWLFLAISTGADTPKVLAEFMQGQLGAWKALKFDGGGSSQLWFASVDAFTIDPGGEKRPLSNFLALYGERGKGISLPLSAEPAERILYRVLSAGETADVKVEVRNTGEYTWSPEDRVELQWERVSLLSPLVNALPLEAPVAPGESATWTIQLQGTTYRRYRMFLDGEPFGTDLAVVFVTVPERLEGRRDEITQLIRETVEDWQARGEQSLEQLLQDLEHRAKIAFLNWAQRLAESLIRKLQESCGGMGALAGLVAAIALLPALRRR